MPLPVRLNKYLADQKLASRREADVLIAAGKVLVNGEKAVLGQKVTADDKVTLLGKPKKYQYLAYYKGRGIITHSPGEGETDIVTKISADYGLTGLHPVGRLDKDSEGLIILSNDGRITGPLLEPDTDHEKEYQVVVDKNLTSIFVNKMAAGVNIEGYQTKPTTVIRSKRNDKSFNIILTEGKKHQIRRMCAALGYQVQSLKRVRVMNIKILNLKPNQYRKIIGEEKMEFLRLLGL